jgi:hypothetical protein
MSDACEGRTNREAVPNGGERHQRTSWMKQPESSHLRWQITEGPPRRVDGEERTSQSSVLLG